MLTLDKLRCKPKHFHAFTGLTLDEFDTLLPRVEAVYAAAQESRLNYPCRQRAIGAGHPFTLPVAERLLMTLIYWRVYLTQILLGFLFDLDDSNVSREIKRMRKVLLEILPIPMRDSNLLSPSVIQSPSRIRTLKDLLEQHPEFSEVLIDATEQPIFRPQNKLDRRQRYSGKHKQHMIKTQVTTTSRVILHLLGEIPGCVNDNLVLQGSGVLNRIPSDRCVRLDLGYEGIDTMYPDQHIEKAIRAQRGHKLTTLGKLYNQMISRLRIPVEHMIGRLKQFNILDFQYRGRWTDHEDVVTVIAGLVNFIALGNLSWTCDP